MATTANAPQMGLQPPPDATPHAGGLRCMVVTPERTTLDDPRADFVALPLYDGELGVLPGRAPLIARLGFGELRIRTGAVTRRFFVDGGFAQVRDDVVTVLTNRAIPAAEVDAMDASRELEDARNRRASTEYEQAEKTRAVDRARALVRVASENA